MKKENEGRKERLEMEKGRKEMKGRQEGRNLRQQPWRRRPWLRR
jgi:hypothetical protein